MLLRRPRQLSPGTSEQPEEAQGCTARENGQGERPGRRQGKKSGTEIRDDQQVDAPKVILAEQQLGVCGLASLALVLR